MPNYSIYSFDLGKSSSSVSSYGLLSMNMPKVRSNDVCALIEVLTRRLFSICTSVTDSCNGMHAQVPLYMNVRSFS